MSLRVQGIQHLNLSVASLARSVEFYEKALGFRVAFRKNDTVWLEAGDDLLGLSEGDPPEHKPNHWGFRVNDPGDVDAWAEQLRGLDVTLEKGPYDRSDGRSVYFRDPDGYILEIFYVDPSFLE